MEGFKNIKVNPRGEVAPLRFCFVGRWQHTGQIRPRYKMLAFAWRRLSAYRTTMFSKLDGNAKAVLLVAMLLAYRLAYRVASILDVEYGVP